MDQTELTLFPQIFQDFPNILYWRIDFFATNEANDQKTSGLSSLMLKKNQLPTNGLCYVDKINGTCLETWFQIKCTGWIDQDGHIVAYEYMGLFFFFFFLHLRLKIIK